MFGISGTEFIILLIVGVIVLGPSRAAQAILALQRAIEKARGWSAQLREQTAQYRQAGDSTTGDLNDALSAFSPRGLDPRRMIKDAVAEEMQLWLKETKLDQIPSTTQKEK
ncbi:hypothetical protein ACFPGO_00150 [Arcanobacterium canis]|uniref:Translocase n=1 Tax=Arcanobacterium canis TaxID=999183 RepID=A0ABY8G016_9ACTO|nr:hypothetical protein [Arcanobacterium canis]WFM84114.1 hypothetical protein P7079_03835 [Arcanobacterium canis]